MCNLFWVLQIIVVEHGRVVEAGSHTALLQQDGKYAELWARQQSNADSMPS